MPVLLDHTAVHRTTVLVCVVLCAGLGEHTSSCKRVIHIGKKRHGISDRRARNQLKETDVVNVLVSADTMYKRMSE